MKLTPKQMAKSYWPLAKLGLIMPFYFLGMVLALPFVVVGLLIVRYLGIEDKLNNDN